MTSALSWLPRSWFRALGAAAAWAAWVLRVRRRVAMANLRLAFPDKPDAERRAIARAAFRQLGRMVPEFLILPRMSREELEQVIFFEEGGLERLASARAQGKGVVACTAHFGHFDLLAAALSMRGTPVTLIARRMGRSRFNEAWRGARAAAGVEELTVGKGETLKAVRRALGEGHLLGYVIDQNQPLRRAIFPTFFGVPAATSPTPALLQLRTGAPVVFMLSLPEAGGRHRVIVEGPLEVRRTGDREADVLAFMQDLNDRLERWVRLHPELWYWLHRRWKTRPSGEAPSARPRASVDPMPGTR